MMKKRIIKVLSIGVQLRLLVSSFENIANDGPIWYSIFIWVGSLLYIGDNVIKWVQKNLALDKQLSNNEDQKETESR